VNKQNHLAKPPIAWKAILVFLPITFTILYATLGNSLSWLGILGISAALTLLHTIFQFIFGPRKTPAGPASPSILRALEDSETRFRLLFDNMEQGVIIYDKEMCIIEANPTAGSMFGIDIENASGKNLISHQWDCIHEDGTPFNPHTYPVSISVQTGRPVSKEIMGIRGPNQENYTWLLIDSFPKTDPDGHVTGAYCILTDITRLKQIELSLRHERWILEDILESATAGYWDVDKSTGRGYYSPSYKKMFGYSPDELDDREDIWRSLIHPEDQPLVDQILKKPHVAEGKQPFSLECRFRHKQGQWIWAICAGKVLERDRNGLPSRVVGCNFDITSRKQAEREREQFHEHLANMQKLESLGKLAGGVAHDSNNLLQLILGHAEIALEQTPETHPAHNHLKAIQETSQRSAKLVRQLLAFARKQTILPARLNLNQVITDSIPMLKQLTGNDINIHWMADESIGDVLADPTQIDQILTNLCTNAKEAIRGIGTISIQTHNTYLDRSPIPHVKNFLPGGYVELIVGDSGEGIPDEIAGRIFDPFFTTKSLGDGHGLGLSTVYGIVKQNNGLIHLGKSAYGGAAFHIYLPHIETYGMPLSSEQFNEQYTHTPRSPQDIHILLVDDHSNALGRTEQLLKGLGYQVTATVSPTEAILLYEKDPYLFDLVIVDITMPGISGMQLIQRLRTSRKDLLWLLTSNHTSLEGLNSKDSVHNHLLPKPYSQKQLAERIASFFPQKLSSIL
jgi:two-component system cell cycle sensor histidine kinase/response regulator CckA